MLKLSTGSESTNGDLLSIDVEHLLRANEHL